MGAWDLSPWGNDGAADWFGELFDALPLAQRIDSTLRLDAQQHHEEVRAAAAMLIMLGRAYMWPIDVLDEHLQLAIAQMRIVRRVFEGDAEWERAIDSELAILESRLHRGKESVAPSTWTEFFR